MQSLIGLGRFSNPLIVRKTGHTNPSLPPTWCEGGHLLYMSDGGFGADVTEYRTATKEAGQNSYCVLYLNLCYKPDQNRLHSGLPDSLLTLTT